MLFWDYMVPELDDNHNFRNACGSRNAYCWNDMAAKSGNSPISRSSCNRSVTANIGSAIDSDLHEKPLHRIGSIWCRNHVESNLYVFFLFNFFSFSVQNQFFVHSKLLLPILHGIPKSKIRSTWRM